MKKIGIIIIASICFILQTACGPQEEIINDLGTKSLGEEIESYNLKAHFKS